MKNSRPIRMTFHCDQDWSGMTATEKGRFCQDCQKEVFDLRQKSNRTIHTLKEEHRELCGILRIEQVETHLQPIEFRLFKKSRYWLATIGTFISLQISSLKAQDKTIIRTEIHSGDTTNVKTANICRIEERSVTEEPVDVKEVKAKKESNYYWTWRWPFIVKKRKQYYMGFL